MSEPTKTTVLYNHDPEQYGTAMGAEFGKMSPEDRAAFALGFNRVGAEAGRDDPNAGFYLSLKPVWTGPMRPRSR